MAQAVIGSNELDGALVSGIDGATAAYYAETNPSQLLHYVNPHLIAAESALPEGTPIELHITGWQTVIGESAQFVAQQTNQAFLLGKLRNLDGTPVVPWREYPDQVAWGYDDQDLLILRMRKADIPLPILLLVAGIVAGILIAALWDHWANPHTSWSALASPAPSGGSTGGTVPSPGQVYGWLARNWPWLLLGAGALAAAPWAIRQVARLRESENELRAAEGGEF